MKNRLVYPPKRRRIPILSAIFRHPQLEERLPGMHGSMPAHPARRSGPGSALLRPVSWGGISSGSRPGYPVLERG